jgi:DNA-binding transcriptional LysR family regulator
MGPATRPEATMKWNDRIGRRIKLHDLHVLMTVAELGSMGKAAERLNVTQPSISKSVADLEHQLGVRLFDRTPRGVETTAYGRALLTRSMGAFDELRQGIKDIETLSDPAIGEVRVGCPEAIAAGFLAAVIDQFSKGYPRAIVTVNPADHVSAEFGQLRDRRVDILIGRIPGTELDDDIGAEPLYQDRLYIVAGRNSSWARKRKLMLSDLLQEPWMLTPSMQGTLLDEFRANGVTAPKVTVRAYSTHQSTHLIATNRFISALSGSLLRFTLNREALKVLPVNFPTRGWSVGIMHLKSRNLAPTAQVFMDHIRKVAANLVGHL